MTALTGWDTTGTTYEERSDLKRFSMRQGGSKSVMIWAAFSWYGLSDIVYLDGKRDARGYCQTLEEGSLPFVAETFRESQFWTFQQDNTSIHRSEYSQNWLFQKNIRLLECLDKCPDLHIIENIWKRLARFVYHRHRQFKNIEELKESIIETWSVFQSNIIRKLYR